MLRYRYGDTASLVPGLAEAPMAVTATRLRAPSVLTDLSTTHPKWIPPQKPGGGMRGPTSGTLPYPYRYLGCMETLSNSSTVESSAVVSSVNSAMSPPSLGAWSNIHLSEQHNSGWESSVGSAR